MQGYFYRLRKGLGEDSLWGDVLFHYMHCALIIQTNKHFLHIILEKHDSCLWKKKEIPLESLLPVLYPIVLTLSSSI